jgi:hypothetical protein
VLLLVRKVDQILSVLPGVKLFDLVSLCGGTIIEFESFFSIFAGMRAIFVPELCKYTTVLIVKDLYILM